MVCSDAVYHLRRSQLCSLAVRVADKFACEQAKSAVEEIRFQYKHNWGLSREVWLSTKNANQEIQELLESGIKRLSPSESRAIRPSTQLQRDQDTRDRYESMIYCDVQLEILDRILSEINQFQERRLDLAAFENISRASEGRSSQALHEWKVKYAFRQLCRVESMHKDTFNALNSINKVGWKYSRYAVVLQKTTKLTQVEIERLVSKKYRKDHNQGHRRNEKDFRRIFKLLKQDDQQGWEEVLSWPHDDRSAFEEWVDKKAKDIVKDGQSKERTVLDELVTPTDVHSPVLARLGKWKFSRGLRCKEIGAKWRHCLRSQKHRRKSESSKDSSS